MYRMPLITLHLYHAIEVMRNSYTNIYIIYIILNIKFIIENNLFSIKFDFEPV
ncbi:hypothetical protein QKV36_gp116 [Erannis ankeraria nucleopolyhedrovirus]|uniref:hypothetical protein n=1 Tax=Erannis ankeraria nucleopolyhedrovirus TaxID=2913600 RepID=UPI00248205FE|nr:hypothetical protein QKV36_gp116 [Erannis ankeraria nucleopolyhedrovirus]UJZ89064.1 hypothetical protein Erangp116 [Erannis ankeraria nucleopolyhedrovirus]